MGFDDRLLCLIIGLVIGFVLGRANRSIKTIEKKVDHVDKMFDRRDESGFMRRPLVADIAFILVLMISVWASIQTGRTNAQLKETTESNDRTVNCTASYLAKTIEALNERTTYSSDQSSKNVVLQKNQERFLSFVLKQPPPTDPEVTQALVQYQQSLAEFLSSAGKLEDTQQMFQYPTEDEFRRCVEKE